MKNFSKMSSQYSKTKTHDTFEKETIITKRNNNNKIHLIFYMLHWTNNHCITKIEFKMKLCMHRYFLL